MGRILVLFACAAFARGSVSEALATKERAHLAYVAGRYAEAESEYRRALAEFGAEGGLGRAAAYENLGVAIRAQGRAEEARPILEEALRQITELAGAESPATIQAMHNLAALYWSAGELAAAEELSLRAGRPADPATAVTWYANLSAAEIAKRRFAAAEDYSRLGLALAEQSLPKNHGSRAALLNNLAQVCRFTGRHVEAERYYLEAIEIWRRTVGPDHPNYAQGLRNLGAFYDERARSILAKPVSASLMNN